MTKPMILILCTGNSCRSQMAEYFLQSVVAGIADVVSAGSSPAGYVHPMAIEVMGEKGFDLKAAVSKSMHDFENRPVAVVITVCGNAEQGCPQFPKELSHYCWTFDDPADAEGTPEEQLVMFRRVRDEIERVFMAYGRGWIDTLGLRESHDLKPLAECCASSC